MNSDYTFAYFMGDYDEMDRIESIETIDNVWSDLGITQSDLNDWHFEDFDFDQI